MKKISRVLIIAILIIAAVVAAYQSFFTGAKEIDSLIAYKTLEDKAAAIAWQDNRETVIGVVDSKGKISDVYRFKSDHSDYVYQIADVAISEKYIYALRNKLNSKNSNILKQELLVLKRSGAFSSLRDTFDMDQDDEEENTEFDYRWLYASGDTVTVIGSGTYDSSIKRKTYEYGTVMKNTLSLKSKRLYPTFAGEGIYKVASCGTDIAYISASGRVYAASEKEVKEIYPARVVESLMYVSFISYAESGYVYIGEYETGDVLKLNVSTGDEITVFEGNSAFNGSSLYAYRDAVSFDMKSNLNHTAVVYNSRDHKFVLLLTDDGMTYEVSSFSYNNFVHLKDFAIKTLIYTLGGWVAFFIIYMLVNAIRVGHTIMERLIAAMVPLMLLTMVLFGFISFRYYKSAIDANFIKQVEDEGNMMSALFGPESFREIEYPYDYSGDAYNYVKRQMEVRDVYIRSLSYESGSIYIGVDKNNPCHYPYEILMNNSARSLYENAALTGTAVTGTVRDTLGERIVCITPIGGSYGDVVYLLETGIYKAEISEYTNSYIRNFVIVTAACLIILLITLLILFYKILEPIAEIRANMQKFADGDRTVRIPIKTEDELTGIAQVFNKMADDINIQILSLEKLSDTYYRFVPPSIINMLGKNNLSTITFGTNVQGQYAVMNARIFPQSGLSVQEMEPLMNRFFNLIHRYTRNEDVITIVDDANLQSIMMIFQNGTESAISTALTILACVDAENKLHGEKEQLEIRFVIDQTYAYFGICGDEARYLPVVMAPEFEPLLEQRMLLGLLGSRLLITDDAYASVSNMDSYAHRYIGRVEAEERTVGLHDIYYDKPSNILRLYKQTEKVFAKAIDLYEKGYYYEAKNMFAMVLRENSYDMAARYYIFKCESQQN